MKKKTLVSSIITIALCFSVIAGSTYALFTDRKDLDVSVTAGNVELTAYYDTTSMQTWSVVNPIYSDLGATNSNNFVTSDVRTDGEFDNGGTAKFVTDAQSLSTSVVIDRMTPGDVAKFKIDVTNLSNVNVQYRVRLISRGIAGYTDLTPALVTTAYVDGYNYILDHDGDMIATNWKFIEANDPINDIWITINFPDTSNVIAPKDSYDENTQYIDPITGNGLFNPDNYYQNAKAEMFFVVEAVQANGVAFKEASASDDFFDANGNFILNGNFNGGTADGITPVIAAPDTNRGTWGSATIPAKGTTTYSNLVIDATNQNSVGNTFMDLDDGVDSTLIFADNAKVIAKENDVVVCSLPSRGESFTMMVDETSKLVATGEDAAILLAQGWDGSVVNLVFNGSAAQCLELNDGAVGFAFFGNDGEYLTVNFYVESVDDLNQYKALIQAEDTKVNWYVGGVLYTTTVYN